MADEAVNKRIGDAVQSARRELDKRSKSLNSITVEWDFEDRQEENQKLWFPEPDFPEHLSFLDEFAPKDAIEEIDGKYILGEGLTEYNSLQDAKSAYDAKLREWAEEVDTSGSFGQSMSGHDVASKIFDAFPQHPAIVEEWGNTKWGSWYLRFRDEDGVIRKISVRDHDASRKDMGIPDKTFYVEKSWTPDDVGAALIRAWKYIQDNSAPAAETDRAYLAAVERGDTETAQRIVDDAAKRAGFAQRAMHGTPRGGITEFRPDADGAIYFTDNDQIAKQYTWHRGLARTPSKSGQVHTVMLSLGRTRTIDALGKRHDNIPFPGVEWKPKVFGNLPKNAISVAEAVKRSFAEGYDSVVIKDVVDTADLDDKTKSTVYAVKSPSQIKSADAITRDDTGRIIPPSERFNPERDDIRMAAAALDAPDTAGQDGGVKGRRITAIEHFHEVFSRPTGRPSISSVGGFFGGNVQKSNRAMEAEDHGLVDGKELVRLTGIPWDTLSRVVPSQEWHHVGYGTADYYSFPLTTIEKYILDSFPNGIPGSKDFGGLVASISVPKLLERKTTEYRKEYDQSFDPIQNAEYRDLTEKIQKMDGQFFAELKEMHPKPSDYMWVKDKTQNDHYMKPERQAIKKRLAEIRKVERRRHEEKGESIVNRKMTEYIERQLGKIYDEVEQLKRTRAEDQSDAITRDDQGRIIPPSERFNQQSDDIRYSVRARAPLFGANNRAIASLAVQHLMGEKLDTERAEKAAYLFAASGTTPDQMIADAKKLAESKVAQQAKKHIENRDPNAAHQVMSQQAEYDSIVALRTGMKSGLKMGQEAERAKQSAEKKLLLNARGEDLQQFIIDTGIDWTETLLSSLPEAFAEWEKASKDAEEKAKAEGAPEGPQQEQEPPPADPAELEARDKRMREFVAAVRAWGDAERAKREKEADDRRKKEQERIEKGESGEEADDTDADPGGEQAEGMEPEGLVIPKELLQAHGVDIRNAQEVAHLIRIWMADWLVRQSKGRLTHQTVWKDREAVEKYRKTMVSQLRDMANGMVEQGWSMTVIHNRISDIPSTARPDTIERRTASIVAMIQAHSIRQTRAQLITDIRKNIKKKAIKGKRHDALNEDLEGKINSEQELTARYLRRILTWSPEKVDAEIVAIQARLKERTELYSEQNPDAKVALDVEFHRDLMRLRVLKEWGGLKRMLPAQIKQAGIAIDGWLVSAQERLYRRWWAMEEQIGKLVTALNEGIVPDDPEQARIQVSRISGWIKDNIATVRQRLEGLIRQQHDPIKRQAAQAAIDEIMFTLSRGTEIYRTVANAYRQAFVEAVNDIAGGKNAATAYMKHLEEEIPIEVAEQVSRQGYDGRGGGRVMTYNQALQLYASITQRGYASNVKLHKREEHAALLEGIFTTEDLALIVRLREIYEERRGRLSEVVQEVSGMLVWRPDPLYMPVRVKMPKKGGFQSKGDPSTWMPLARSLTPRVHHGLDFDEGATLTGTFYDATEDAARAIGFGTRGLILRGVLGNSTIQESADRYYGGGEMADMNQQVVQALDGFGRTDSDSTHGILRTIRELNAYAALSWNPMTALKQTVSFPVFAMALDGGFGQVLSAIKDFDREALRDIMESDGFKARYEGGFMPEVAEILSDGRRNPIARFYKLGMTTVQIGDFVPSLIVAPGLYKARLAQNIDAGMDEATAKERAMTWTWEMIEATQQTSRAEMLPKFYRQTGAGSEAMKLILQFSSAPLLQLSHEYHAWRDAMAGVDGAWKRLGRAVLVNHIIIPQMLEMVKKMFYWLIGRDEPEDQQLFWTIFNGATIGAVGRIMIIGILAETAYNAVVEGKIRYGGQMVPAESLTRTGAYAVRAFLHDPFDPEDGMDAFQSDIVKALEGMLAPFRYGKEFYDNRIAQ